MNVFQQCIWKYVKGLKIKKIPTRRQYSFAKYLPFLQTLLWIPNGVVVKAQNGHGSMPSKTILNGHFLTFFYGFLRILQLRTSRYQYTDYFTEF